MDTTGSRLRIQSSLGAGEAGHHEVARDGRRLGLGCLDLGAFDIGTRVVAEHGRPQRLELSPGDCSDQCGSGFETSSAALPTATMRSCSSTSTAFTADVPRLMPRYVTLSSRNRTIRMGQQGPPAAPSRHLRRHVRHGEAAPRNRRCGRPKVIQMAE
jgi:hypothetical protein